MRARRVAIVHNAVDENAGPSTRDVLAQVALVQAALKRASTFLYPAMTLLAGAIAIFGYSKWGYE